jgi:Fur family ferric uptake transcriptional regulator
MMEVGTAAAVQGQNADFEQVIGRLRARGRRITTPRRLLLHCLLDGPEHPTAEDLAAEVHARAPDVHLSTIYRNLHDLERLGVVVHAHLGHGPATYHLAPVGHGHLVCAECGDTIEVPATLFEDLADQALQRFGFEVDPAHFAILGRCRRCSAP